jgi:hypothetical protein
MKAGTGAGIACAIGVAGGIVMTSGEKGLSEYCKRRAASGRA